MPDPMLYLRAVLWSFIGIRRRSAATTEQQQLKPALLIGTALGLAGLFVLLLVVVATHASAAPLQVPDTMAQRALACTGCHGEQGKATPQGYIPRIAGKPAGYLSAQLLAFRDGRRLHDGMARLLANLDDRYIAELADYFAALHLDYPPPAPTRASAASLALGKRLVREGDRARDLPACLSCHGAAMTGVAPAVPGLLGLPRDYLVAQLGAWRNRLRVARPPDCMAAVAQRLQPDEILAVADWLSAQALPADTTPAQGLPHPMPIRCGGVAQ